MSVLLSTCVATVRDLLRDNRVPRPVVDKQELKRLLITRAVMMGAKVPRGLQWDTTGITTASGTADYDYAASAQSIVMLKLVGDDSREVPIVTPHMLEDRYRRGDSDSYTTGSPRMCYLTEYDNSGTRTVKVRFGPVPDATYTIEVLRSVLQTNALTDATVIDMSDLGAQALNYDVASMTLLRMREEDRQRLGVSAEVAGTWMQMAKEALADEAIRLGAQEIALVPSPWHSL